MDERIVTSDDPLASTDTFHSNCRGIWVAIKNDEAILVDGEPSDAMKMHTEKLELRTGKLAANIRHTRASYSRPRKMVEHPKKARPRPSWG